MEDFSDIICKDSGTEFILLATLVSMTLGHNLTPYEQNLFGNFLQAIGQNLSTMSIIKAKCITDLKDISKIEKEVEINDNITNDTIIHNLAND